MIDHWNQMVDPRPVSTFLLDGHYIPMKMKTAGAEPSAGGGCNAAQRTYFGSMMTVSMT
jgi:hypothetical protein